MRSTTVFQPNQQLGSPPADVELVNWPLRDGGPRVWLALVTVVAAPLAAAAWADNLAVGLICVAALAVSLWRVWIPVRFQFGPKGIVQEVFGRRRRIAWSAIRRCEVRRQGVLLLPTYDRRPLAVVAGLYVRWGAKRDELLTIVNYYLGPRGAM